MCLVSYFYFIRASYLLHACFILASYFSHHLHCTNNQVKTHSIRIIAGQWRSRLLSVLSIEGLRPTPNRVRETLFNWLGQNLEGRSCLDVYAGTGALGFEAASRGAAQVVMIERNSLIAQEIQNNIARLNATYCMSLIRADANIYLSKKPSIIFDFIFLDPPFAQLSHTDFLEVIALAARHLSTQGKLYVEAPFKLDDTALCALPAPLKIFRYGQAGHVHYHLLSF